MVRLRPCRMGTSTLDNIVNPRLDSHRQAHRHRHSQAHTGTHRHTQAQAHTGTQAQAHKYTDTGTKPHLLG